MPSKTAIANCAKTENVLLPNATQIIATDMNNLHIQQLCDQPLHHFLDHMQARDQGRPFIKQQEYSINAYAII